MSQQINLLNPALLRKRFALTATTGMLSAVAIALVASGGLAYYEQQRLQDTRVRATELETKLKDMSARLEKLAVIGEAPKPDRSAEVELAQLGARLQTRQQVVEIMKGGGVGSTTGFSEYMRAFSRQAINGLWLTGFDIAEGGAELKLSGRALSADLVPAYLERLNRESPLQGRHFASMRITEPKSTEAATAERAAKAPSDRAAAPRYLEFEIASAGLGEESPTRSAGRPAATEASPIARLVDRLSAPPAGAQPTKGAP